MIGGSEWPVYDIDVETGLMRLDVCGKLDVSHIADVREFQDLDGGFHDPDTFYSDYEPIPTITRQDNDMPCQEWWDAILAGYGMGRLSHDRQDHTMQHGYYEGGTATGAGYVPPAPTSDASFRFTQYYDYEMKSWPAFFSKMITGEKKHDMRKKSDRAYAVGDKVLLREYDPFGGGYTGRQAIFKITYITSDDTPCALSSNALAQDACILSMEVIPISSVALHFDVAPLKQATQEAETAMRQFFDQQGHQLKNATLQ